MPVLFTVTTPRARLTWSGPAADVKDDRETARVSPPAVFDGGGAEARIRLEEETTYAVWLESTDGAPVALRHADPALGAGLASARGGSIVHGSVRFASVAGRSRFGIVCAGSTEAFLDVTVAPTKASWTDVDAMRAAVERAAAGLALAPLRPVEIGTERDAGRASVPAFLALLREVGPLLHHALREIDRDPEMAVERTLVSVRPHVLRQAPAETIRALRGAPVWPERVPGRPARLGLDTLAHRWLAARLDAVSSATRALHRAEAARPPSPRRAALVAELACLGADLAEARRLPFLASAGRSAPGVPPLALRTRPAYARAAECLVALAGTLRLGGDVRAPAEDLSALYETWTALDVVRAFAQALGTEAPLRPFGVRASDTRLGRGAQAAVRLRSERGEVEIVRQPRFAGPPALLVQIPDLVVTVRAAGAVRRVVLDAKYRLDARGHAPPGDALGALHRYRDAIVGPDGRALIDTAAVLFPARLDDGFAAARVWTSLETLGVGAVPLLPGSTEWLDRFAEALVRDVPLSASGR